ncbi:MAG TPA: redoxin domain-containing protein [Candidatus Bathyarchaeia archaeon]|nr:redoxin domain-containing protein [Candidatus Bathyarchaeia archaeon]
MRFNCFTIALALTALAFLFAASHAQKGNAQSQGRTSAAQALKRINSDLEQKSKTMPPYDYLAYLEKTMNDFLAKYPNTPEAAQAHFSLAKIYASIGNNQKAADHLTAYLSMPGEKGGPDAVAQAKYVLGNCYLGLERFDDAEKSLRDVVSSSKIDPRISDAARSDLVRIATLRKLKIGLPAIDISATSFQGKKIRLLNDYKGKVVLLDFWASWCGPCRMEMPNVIATYNELHQKGFEIVGVSLDKEKEPFENFIRDNKMEWPQLYDGKYWMSDYARLYAVTSIPATFLLDRKGVIRFRNVRGEELREAVVKLLDEK